MNAVFNSPAAQLCSNGAMELGSIHPGMCARFAAARTSGETAPVGLARELASRLCDSTANGRDARVLTTVMLTDIVDSTRCVAEMGDRDWVCVLDHHDNLASELVRRHSGVLAKTTGDGVLATFDVPSSAVRCGLALQTAAKLIGLSLRVGVHTGEVERRSADVRGVAVHAAARVMRKCAPGEVLVSRVVTDLAFGAGLTFAERGAHELKGLPGHWDLFAARV